MLKPLGHRILVEVEPQQKKESIVEVVSLKDEDTQYAKIIAIGNGSYNNMGKHTPVDASVGDRVIIRKKSGMAVESLNEKVRLINEGDIIAIV